MRGDTPVALLRRREHNAAGVDAAAFECQRIHEAGHRIIATGSRGPVVELLVRMVVTEEGSLSPRKNTVMGGLLAQEILFRPCLDRYGDGGCGFGNK